MIFIETKDWSINKAMRACSASKVEGVAFKLIISGLIILNVEDRFLNSNRFEPESTAAPKQGHFQLARSRRLDELCLPITRPVSGGNVH